MISAVGVTGVVVQSLGDIYTSNGNIGAWNDRNEAGTFSSASIDQSGKFMVVARASASLSGDLLFSSDAGKATTLIYCEMWEQLMVCCSCKSFAQHACHEV